MRATAVRGVEEDAAAEEAMRNVAWTLTEKFSESIEVAQSVGCFAGAQ